MRRRLLRWTRLDTWTGALAGWLAGLFGWLTVLPVARQHAGIGRQCAPEHQALLLLTIGHRQFDGEGVALARAGDRQFAGLELFDDLGTSEARRCRRQRQQCSQ